MAEPITWRNINAPNLGTSVAALQQANSSFRQGIGDISSGLRDIGSIQDRQDAELKEQNTQAVLNRLNEIRSQTDLDKIAASGELSVANLDKQYGKSIDTNAILSRFNSLDNEIRAEELGRLKYADAMQERAQRPVRQQALLDLARGNFDAADKGATELQDGELATRINTARIGSKEKARLAGIEQTTQDYLTMFRDIPLDQNVGTEPFNNYLTSMQKNGATVEEQMAGLEALRQGIASKGLGTQYQDEVQYLTSQQNLIGLEEKLRKFDEANPYVTATGANTDMQKDMTERVIPQLEELAPEHDYFGWNNVEGKDIGRFVNKYVGKEYVVQDGKGVPLSGLNPADRKALATSDNVVIVTPQTILDAAQRSIDSSLVSDPGIDKLDFESAIAEVIAQYDPRILKAERQGIVSEINKRKGELFSIKSRTNRKSD